MHASELLSCICKEGDVIACLRLGASVAPGQDGVHIKTCLELSKTLYKVINID